MIFLPAVDSIIFDLDGTLWDASESTAKGWNQVLKNIDPSTIITPDAVRSVAGLPFDQCIEKLFPNLSENNTDFKKSILF